MRVFNFDPADYRDQYLEQGWIHISDGITEEFYQSALEFAERELQSHNLEDFAIKGKKEQSLYEFPSDVDDYPGELFDVVADLCGLNRETMTLSERHIQAYEPNADPEPAAHKDRFGSQVSVGLSIAVPTDSRLVVYPYSHREINPFNLSAAYRNTLEPDELPEVALKNARELEIADRPRDVVAFPGSTTWHMRRRSANSLNLYLKFNDFNCDPLGEDPTTVDRRARTISVAAYGDGELGDHVPTVSRRLDAVSRQYTRNNWQEVLLAKVYGEEPFAVSEADFELMRAVDGKRDVATLARELGDSDPTSIQQRVRRLAERGALDLAPAVVPAGRA